MKSVSLAECFLTQMRQLKPNGGEGLRPSGVRSSDDPAEDLGEEEGVQPLAGAAPPSPADVGSLAAVWGVISRPRQLIHCNHT
jgi:hypothetical protein